MRRIRKAWRKGLLNRLSSLIIVGLIGALAAACSGPAAGSPQGEARTAPIQRGAIEVTVSATGDVAAAAQATLSFSGSGIVGQVLVEVGDRVRPGDPLMEIDPVSLGATAAQYQADLIDARKALKDLLEPPTGLEF